MPDEEKPTIEEAAPAQEEPVVPPGAQVININDLFLVIGRKDTELFFLQQRAAQMQQALTKLQMENIRLTRELVELRSKEEKTLPEAELDPDAEPPTDTGGGLEGAAAPSA